MSSKTESSLIDLFGENLTAEGKRVLDEAGKLAAQELSEIIYSDDKKSDKQ